MTSGEDLESRNAPEHVGADEDRGGSLAGRWINSDDLRVGDMVFLRGRGEVRIDRIGVRRERTSVCNLTVRDLHTFAAGAIQALVHNSSDSSNAPNDEGIEIN